MLQRHNSQAEVNISKFIKFILRARRLHEATILYHLICFNGIFSALESLVLISFSLDHEIFRFRQTLTHQVKIQTFSRTPLKITDKFL